MPPFERIEFCIQNTLAVVLSIVKDFLRLPDFIKRFLWLINRIKIANIAYFVRFLRFFASLHSNFHARRQGFFALIFDVKIALNALKRILNAKCDNWRRDKSRTAGAETGTSAFA
jgi:hypothetical protein